jgi:DNA helicase IV
MATPVQKLRLLVDEPTTNTYTDSDLNQRLVDASNDLNVTARDIWQEKMAAAAKLVNLSEGGSTRSASQIFDHAKAMWEHFSSVVGESGAPKIRKLSRL